VGRVPGLCRPRTRARSDVYVYVDADVMCRPRTRARSAGTRSRRRMPSMRRRASAADAPVRGEERWRRGERRGEERGEERRGERRGEESGEEGKGEMEERGEERRGERRERSGEDAHRPQIPKPETRMSDLSPHHWQTGARLSPPPPPPPPPRRLPRLPRGRATVRAGGCFHELSRTSLRAGGLGCRVSGVGCWVLGVGCRV
jgi:hypothetical protein